MCMCVYYVCARAWCTGSAHLANSIADDASARPTPHPLNFSLTKSRFISQTPSESFFTYKLTVLLTRI